MNFFSNTTKILLFGAFFLFSVFFFLLSAPAAQAAVPVWTVGFDIDTDLSAFLYYLNQHERAQELADIEKAREDVNKLIYEAFVELRDQPLLLEYHKIEQNCESLGGTLKPGEGAPGEPVSSLCRFQQQIENSLKTRGITIEEESLGPNPGGTTGNLCRNGVQTSEGCLVIKQEGRIIRNPDDFIFEDPRQKARNFIMCYLGDWKKFPFDTEKPDEVRDALKAHLLFKYSRKQKWTQTAPPEDWYTQGRCQIIMAQYGCPAQVSSTAAGQSDTIQNGKLTLNAEGTCQFARAERFPTLEKALGTDWEWKDLAKANNNCNNSLQCVKQNIEDNVESIISDAEQLRQAEYIAGQGIRAEKYNIGFEADDGKNYFLNTENVISPAVTLLQKLQAAQQAQFDLAGKAFQQVEKGERTAENQQASINPDNRPPFQLYKPDKNQLPKGKEQGKYTEEGLPAPFEDQADYADLEEAAPEFKELQDRGGQISSLKDIPENYFNQYFRDIMEMHKNTFANTIKRWFTGESGAQPEFKKEISLVPGTGGGGTGNGNGGNGNGDNTTSGDLSVGNCDLKFGEVQNVENSECMIKNNSQEETTVSVTFNFEGSDAKNPFLINPTGEQTIAGDDSLRIGAVFTPGDDISYSGTLTVSQQNSDEDPIQIKVSGTGISDTTSSNGGTNNAADNLPEISLQSSNAELKEFYNVANNKFFNGELSSSVEVGWSDDNRFNESCSGSTNLGLAYLKSERLLINQYCQQEGAQYLQSTEAMQSNMLHEMAHFSADTNQHDQAYCQEADRLEQESGISIARPNQCN